MQFMVIERFRDQNAKAVYSRFREKGRLMHDGVGFVGSWVTADLSSCRLALSSMLTSAT